jgi:hypothetical protein
MGVLDLYFCSSGKCQNAIGGTVSPLLIYGNGGIPVGTIPTVVDEKEGLDFV